MGGCEETVACAITTHTSITKRGEQKLFAKRERDETCRREEEGRHVHGCVRA